MLRKVNLEITVLDYDRIGGSDPIGKVMLGYNRCATSSNFIRGLQRVGPGPSNIWNKEHKYVFNKRTIKVCVNCY